MVVTSCIASICGMYCCGDGFWRPLVTHRKSRACVDSALLKITRETELHCMQGIGVELGGLRLGKISAQGS